MFILLFWKVYENYVSDIDILSDGLIFVICGYD